MKKPLLLLLSLCSLLFATSCKKSQDTDQPDSKTIPVQFSVGTFTETITYLKSGKISRTLSVPLDSSISHLYCRIYTFGFSGPILLSEDQTPATANFGTFSTRLGEGSYTAVFLGSKSPLQLTYSDFRFNQISDIFYKKINFKVTAQPLNQPIVMSRIVAGLNVLIEDAVPSGISKVEVTIPEDNNIYTFVDSTRSGATSRVINFPIAATDVGLVNKTLNTYAFRLNQPMTVTIKVYNTNNTVHSEKIVPNVTFYANKVTTLTGKLFNNKASFDVSVNSEWDTPMPIVTF